MTNWRRWQASWCQALNGICITAIIHLGQHQAVMAQDDVAPFRQAGLRAKLCNDAHLQRPCGGHTSAVHRLVRL